MVGHSNPNELQWAGKSSRGPILKHHDQRKTLFLSRRLTTSALPSSHQQPLRPGIAHSIHIQPVMFRTRLLRTPRQALALNLRASANGSSSNGSFNTINAIASSNRGSRRSLHSVPSLPHDYSQGVPNLMSPGGFALAWTDYMTVTLDKLNAMIAGESLLMSDS